MERSAVSITHRFQKIFCCKLSADSVHPGTVISGSTLVRLPPEKRRVFKLSRLPFLILVSKTRMQYSWHVELRVVLYHADNFSTPKSIDSSL
jgi:hypothetical protein